MPPPRNPRRPEIRLTARRRGGKLAPVSVAGQTPAGRKEDVMAAYVARPTLPSFRPTKGIPLCLITTHPGGHAAAPGGSTMTTIRVP